MLVSIDQRTVYHLLAAMEWRLFFVLLFSSLK